MHVHDEARDERRNVAALAHGPRARCGTWEGR